MSNALRMGRRVDFAVALIVKLNCPWNVQLGHTDFGFKYSRVIGSEM